MITEQRKTFRLLRPDLFGLDKHKSYIVSETDNGYTMKVNDTEWCGFPKSVVENSRKLFGVYSHKDRRTYNNIKKLKKQRPRIPFKTNHNQKSYNHDRD